MGQSLASRVVLVFKIIDIENVLILFVTNCLIWIYRSQSNRVSGET